MLSAAAKATVACVSTVEVLEFHTSLDGEDKVQVGVRHVVITCSEVQ